MCASGAGAQGLGDPEGQVERLAAVEPGVAHRLVAGVEVGVEDLVGPAQALGHVVAGELKRARDLPVRVWASQVSSGELKLPELVRSHSCGPARLKVPGAGT